MEATVSATLRLVREGIGIDASPTRPFDVADGETANFRCHGANIWPRFVASLVKPDLAISLRRE
jgi:hypothetical protein